jgi:stage II sporulation protein D
MRRTVLLITALLAALAVPATAEAASTKWVIKGRGFGHGAGMSQYGAYGFATQGYDYRRILSHYYTGTELGSAEGRTVRVLLGDGRGSVKFDGASGINGTELDPAKQYTATRDGGKVKIAGVGSFDANPAKVRGTVIRFLGTTMNGVRNGGFRSYLELRPSSYGGLTLVNALGIDNYVKGVVSGEVPSSWPAETLKAQAVAARTYAMTTGRGGSIFDQYPDTRSQVYRGVNGETVATNAAVDSTSGQVVTYQGTPAVTYFFSTSGGRTENVENVFIGGVPKPWLKSVEDPFDDASPKHTWKFVLTTSQMQSRLSGLVKGKFRGIKVVQRGVSPRIVYADVLGSRGKTRVTGPTLRTRLGLYDTWFRVRKVTGSSAKRYRTSAPPQRARAGGSSSLQSSGWVQSSRAASPESSREGLLRLEE